MYCWGLPLGCFCFMISLAAGIVTLWWLDGIAMRAGVGAAALFAYAAVLCVHYFERSSCPVDPGPAMNADRQQKP